MPVCRLILIIGTRGTVTHELGNFRIIGRTLWQFGKSKFSYTFKMLLFVTLYNTMSEC